MQCIPFAIIGNFCVGVSFFLVHLCAPLNLHSHTNADTKEHKNEMRAATETFELKLVSGARESKYHCYHR